MDKKKRGFTKLIELIGEDFYKKNENNAVFCWGEEEKGLFCFLGIDLHPENKGITLSANMEEWDIFASCFVTDTDIIIDKCRLPE